MAMRRPPGTYGPISMRAVRNWLLMSPRTSRRPAPRAGPLTVTGRWPRLVCSHGRPQRRERIVQRCHRTRPQRCVTVDHVRSLAEGGKCGDESRRRAGQARRQIQRTGSSCPPVPTTVVVRILSSTVTSIPKSPRHSSIATVSSPSGRLANVETPSARAAQTRARLAMLFDPGTGTTASMGCGTGATRKLATIPAVEQPVGIHAPSNRRGTTRPSSHRPTRPRRRGCPRCCERLRSWQC